MLNCFLMFRSLNNYFPVSHCKASSKQSVFSTETGDLTLCPMKKEIYTDFEGEYNNGRSFNYG